MKKALSALLVLLMFTLTACGGNVRNVKIYQVESELYSANDINAAIDTAISYFRLHFDGCTLTEISYIGDASASEAQEWAAQYDADEAIVLTSSFAVGPSGGDGSLNPNSTYSNWTWILVRNGTGAWRHATHGY